MFSRRGEKRNVEGSSLETIVAILVPKKVLTDSSFEERARILKPDFGDYFESSAFAVARAGMREYGSPLTIDHTTGKSTETYVFTLPGGSMVYHVQGILGVESSGRSFQSGVTATFQLQQPTLDLAKAGRVLSVALETHYLNYRSDNRLGFGVFLQRKSEAVQEGVPLLREMGIVPQEVARLQTVMYFAFHVYHQFSPEELSRMGFNGETITRQPMA